MGNAHVQTGVNNGTVKERGATVWHDISPTTPPTKDRTGIKEGAADKPNTLQQTGVFVLPHRPRIVDHLQCSVRGCSAAPAH